jgi:glycosyltransferase involved in cell wall biosynthesis
VLDAAEALTSLHIPAKGVANVVIVSDAADAKGGASVVAIQSALLLAKAGLNVSFFAATGPFVPLGEVPDNLRVLTLGDGLNLMKAPAHKRAVQSLWNSDAARAFELFVGGLDPLDTIIHVHSFQVQLTSSVIRRAKALGFPIVVTSHDYGLACPYSGMYNYNTGAPCGKRALSAGCIGTVCNESKSVPGKLWHVAKAIVQRDLGHAAKAADHLAFVSGFSRDIMQPYLPASTPVTVIPNPIDLPKGEPRQLSPAAPFLFVGRLTNEKGPVLFAEACAKLGFRGWIAGTGAEEERIRRANPNIEFLGWQSPAQVRDLMLRARALVFPSRWYEGQPLTVQEAQSLGLPVIASDVSAATPTIIDGVSGRIFRNGDADDLAAKMGELLDDATAIRMGLESYERFWANPPTVEKHLQATLSVYRQVMESRGG